MEKSSLNFGARKSSTIALQPTSATENSTGCNILREVPAQKAFISQIKILQKDVLFLPTRETLDLLR